MRRQRRWDTKPMPQRVRVRCLSARGVPSRAGAVYGPNRPDRIHMNRGYPAVVVGAAN